MASANYMTIQQIAEIKAELAKNLHARRDTLMFMVALNTGLRSSDTKALTMEKLSKGKLVMKKTGKPITMMLPKELMEALSDFCRDNKIKDNQPIFYTLQTRVGKQRASRKEMTYQQFYHILKTAGEKIGINIGTHSMRKTFGRIAYEQTKDINIVAKLLGHASPATTLSYIGITENVLKDVRKSIGLIG